MVFNGTIESDFLKLVSAPDSRKADLIDYSATDFLTLRDALVRYIKAVYPLDYQNFSESDLGMMLIEQVAYMGAILSMKADLLANENFIATARNRNNVKKLLELIGVRMKGPIGSTATTVLTLNTATVSDEITLAAGSRVISISSPEDSAPLNFTIYKTVAGQLDDPTSESSIVLSRFESEENLGVEWNNLILLEGALVTQTGTFNSTDTIKTIPLEASPVIEGSVDVYITSTENDASGAWKRVENLYFASGVTHKIFEVVYDDNYAATILFGDGNIGRVAPQGGTYNVTYRVGGGTRGNIKKEVINVSLTFDEGDVGVLENTSLATGGRDAETVAHAKKYAPLTFKRQDRLVTAEDYSVFANTFIGQTGSSGRARAVVRDAYSSANVLDIYLLQLASLTQMQQATVGFKKELLDAINEKKMLTDEVIIVDGLIRTLDLIISIKVDKALLPNEERIKGKVRNEILSFFSTDNMDFGKALVLADLNRAVFTLPEVRYSTVENLSDNVVADFNEIIQLNNLTINVVGV